LLNLLSFLSLIPFYFSCFSNKGHGFSEDGLKALFKYLSDAYSGDYLELHPNWISSAFIEYKDMNDVFKENER
jgi:hypothetical protein